MERERIQQTQSPREGKDDGSEQERKNPNSLSNLEVKNEMSILPVEFANKSGCGRCG